MGRGGWCRACKGGVDVGRLSGQSSRKVPQERPPPRGCTQRGNWGYPGIGWTYLELPHSLPLSPPSSCPSPRGATPSGHLGTQEIKPSSVQKAPKCRGVAPRREAGGRRVWADACSPPGPEARARHGQGWHLASLGSSQISVRASAGTKPRFLPLLTRMKPSASLLLPAPTQI